MKKPIAPAQQTPWTGAASRQAEDPVAAALPGDAHFSSQWALAALYGINVARVWDDYTGDGIRVAVFDQGIDSTHVDLDGNFQHLLSTDAATLSGSGLPKAAGDNHGTSVAGVIAAERNDVGVVGAAYDADLVSIYTTTFSTSAIANGFTYARQFDVLNNSWGYSSPFADDFSMLYFTATATALQNAATLGRGGLGTVVVQSGGNGYASGDDANLHNFQNSRYVISVAATNTSGNVTSYSTPGASILVAAPGGDSSGGILTTDRVGSLGYVASDYVYMTGTSFSAPLVSAVVALMLDANPNLGYRDVQEILAYTARKTGPESAGWIFNGAENWNNGGLHFDGGVHRLGYGLVDATASVRLAETWGSSHTVSNLQQRSFSRTAGLAIPDDSAGGVTSAITVTEHLEVERVEVTLDMTHPWVGDLSAVLRSPHGTESWLLNRPGKGAYSDDDVHFTFSTVADWGEDAAGLWTLQVFDGGALDVGTLDRWTLTLLGKSASADDVYIFTDEFAEAQALDPSRNMLSDESGANTLNFAAVSTGLYVELAAGGRSLIDGAPLLLGAGTAPRNAIGGDGNDTILGNSEANDLRGMRGNDVLVGGAGDDILTGGDGMDTARYPGPRSSYVLSQQGPRTFVRGEDGNDTLLAVERLQFSDVLVAVQPLDSAASSSHWGTDWRVMSARSDFNADGKSDLLMRNETTGLAQSLLVDGVRTAGTQTYAWGHEWRVISAGSDFNADGKSDVLVRNEITGLAQAFLMEGVQYAGTRTYAWGAEWKVVSARSDFNGDGKSDILVRNDNTGLAQAFLMDGVAYDGTRTYPWGAAWRVISADSDFNGDGKSDVLVRNDSTGMAQAFIMAGVEYADTRTYAWGAEWEVISARSDFNGDGKTDILVRNQATGLAQAFLMDGTRYAGTQTYAWGAEWQVASADSDFNGDGKSDLLVRNQTTGLAQAFLMDGVRYAGTQTYAWGADWHVISGRGDYNGDGKSDLLVRNDKTGLAQAFLMNGVQYAGTQTYGWGVDDYVASAQSDFNGDGNSDIFVRDDVAGHAQAFLMSGVQFIDTVMYGAGTEWQVVS